MAKILNKNSGDIPGTIKAWSTGNAPAGYLSCNGNSVSPNTYPNLAVLYWNPATGFYLYGGGTGVPGPTPSGNFNLPDLRRKVPVGAGGTGSATLGNAVGNSGGVENVTLSENEIPSHKHITSSVPRGQIYNNGPYGSTDYTVANSGGYAVQLNGYNEFTSNTGGGTAHNNIQPSLIVNYIVKI